MLYCVHCGNPIEASGRFCSKCGKEVTAPRSAPGGPAAVSPPIARAAREKATLSGCAIAAITGGIAVLGGGALLVIVLILSRDSTDEISFQKISRPEYLLHFEKPVSWQLQSNESRFVVQPPTGDALNGLAWMAVHAFPNEARDSGEEIAGAISGVLRGLPDLAIDNTFPTLTRPPDGEPVTEEELKEGEAAFFSTLVHFHYTSNGSPWRGLAIGIMQHGDTGRFHYLVTMHSAEDRWEDLNPVFQRFMSMHVGYNL